MGSHRDRNEATECARARTHTHTHARTHMHAHGSSCLGVSQEDLTTRGQQHTGKNIKDLTFSYKLAGLRKHKEPVSFPIVGNGLSYFLMVTVNAFHIWC